MMKYARDLIIDSYIEGLTSAVVAEVVFGADLDAEIERQKLNSGFPYHPDKSTHYRKECPQRIDQNFPHYSANLIPGTNFIAATGPKDLTDLTNMAKDI